MKQFEKIDNYPEELKGRFNSFITTEFDDSMTIEMQMRVLVKWIVKNIDLTNEMSDYLNEFVETFDEKLYGKVADVLNVWLEDGVITEIINEEVFGIINRKIDDFGLNVKNFGGVGDGVTDDTQAFIDASLKADELDVNVFIPYGKYLVDGLVYNDSFYGYGIVLYNNKEITFNSTPLKKSNRYTTSSVQMAKNTYGTYNNASVASVVANEDGAIAEVQGVKTSKEASLYAGRDSVALYAHNRLLEYLYKIPKNSNVNVTNTTLKLPDNYNIETIKETMIIDTFGSEKYTGLIKEVNEQTRIITIEDSWYVTGTSVTGKPDSNDEYVINPMNKIWGLNTNIIIPKNSNGSGVIGEFGILNKNGDIRTGGFDLINVDLKSGFGHRVRGANPIFGFLYGYMAYNSDHAFSSHSKNPNSNALISSFIGSDYDDKGFSVNNNGTMTKLKLNAMGVTNAINKYSHVRQRVFFINKTESGSFEIPSAKGRVGELIFIIKNGNSRVTITSGNELENNISNFIIRNNVVGGLALLKGSNLILISDDNSWFVLSDSMFEGNAPNNVRSESGVPNQSASSVGMTWIDSVSGNAYISVSIGNGASDWKQITT